MMGAAPTAGDVAQALAILAASLVITAAVIYAWLRHIPNSDRWGGLFLREPRLRYLMPSRRAL